MQNDLLQLVRDAGNLLMKHFEEENYAVGTKNGDAGNFITTADIEVDAFLRAGLARLFPRDGILSEETEEGTIDYTGSVWMVDPLDGTKDFVHHGDGFSVIVGRATAGVPDLGIVYAPKINALYYAERRGGAYRIDSNTPLRVSTIGELEKARMIVHIPYADTTVKASDAIVRHVAVAQRIPLGSVGIRCGYIAEGKAEFSLGTFFRASKWDTCASQVIVEEAGGKLTDLNGDPLDYTQKPARWLTPYIASNGLLHAEAIRIAKQIVRVSAEGSRTISP